MRPLYARLTSGSLLRKKGVDEGFGIEKLDIFDLLPGADVLDRDGDLSLNGEGRSPFGSPVEFGEEDAGKGRVFVEKGGLLDSVLANRGIQDEHRFMRGAGKGFGADAGYLLKLLHQVCFCVEAPCRVDEENIGCSGLGSLDRVEGDRRRIALGAPFDDLDICARGPQLELRNGGSSVSVGGGDEDLLALALVILGKFGNGSRFAVPVDPYDEDDVRLTLWEGRGLGERGEEVGFEGIEDLVGRKFGTPFSDLTYLLDEFVTERRAEVGLIEELLELFEFGRIDILPEEGTDLLAKETVFQKLEHRTYLMKKRRDLLR